MAILKKMISNNGIETKYHKIAKVAYDNNKAEVLVYSFYDEDFYNKALEKNNLKTKQEELSVELDNLYLKDPESEKISEIITEINKIAETISTLKDFEDYILCENVYDISDIDEVATDILESFVKTKYFKNAKLV